MDRGTRIANETDALNQVVDGVQSATVTIDNISRASDTRLFPLARLPRALTRYPVWSKTNSATAEESAAASEELSGQAQILEPGGAVPVKDRWNRSAWSTVRACTGTCTYGYVRFGYESGKNTKRVLPLSRFSWEG